MKKKRKNLRREAETNMAKVSPLKKKKKNEIKVKKKKWKNCAEQVRTNYATVSRFKKQESFLEQEKENKPNHFAAIFCGICLCLGVHFLQLTTPYYVHPKYQL